MKKTILVISAIFLIGLLLRFYRLGDIPIGFHRDEAFLGYNAYAILKTAKDMSGNFLPLHLEAFLYSPAGYSYLSIPFIKTFGLSVFSVRFASALFGSLTVLVTYFLAKELFSRNSKFKIPVIAAAMLAFNPWHINLSRTATENTVVVFFIALGVLLFLQWVKSSRNRFFILSFAAFSITLWIYQASRAFLPFFLPLLLIFARDRLSATKVVLWVFVFLITIIFPVLFILSSRELSSRMRMVSLLATDEAKLVVEEKLREDGLSAIPRFLARVFHNKPTMYASQFLDNYFSHFSYAFLFTDKGLPDRYRIPQMGLFYIFELPLLLLGIWKLLRQEKRVGIFLLGWVLLVPIGSGLTFDDVPNLQRTLLVFPALCLIEAIGIRSIMGFGGRHYYTSILVLLGLASIAVYSFIFYIHQYYVHGPRYRPWYRNDGYRELVEQVDRLLFGYEKVVITNRESAPAIFFLFYDRYDPRLFAKETEGISPDALDRMHFYKYEFTQEECPFRTIRKDGTTISTGEKGTLYVNSSLCKIPEDAVELAVIRRGDDSMVFRILEKR